MIKLRVFKNFLVTMLVFVITSFILLQMLNASQLQMRPKLFIQRILETVDLRYRPPLKTCEPQKKIMFMKTHKTAGTSVMNIIERFAWRNNLTIALPNGGNADQFNYPNMFDAKRMVYPLLPWEREFDVICHHMRFNMKETNKTLPRNTTKYVTMLREPGKLFESIFDYYYELVNIFHAVPSSSRDHLSEWLDKAPTLFKRRNKGGYWFMGKNMAFYDLGFQNDRESEEYLKSAVEKMERDFDLVMITDHFLESLILLKDLMCWDTVDLISLKLNARKTSSEDQEPELREKIRNWNKADTYLFDHFNATLWRKVDAFGRQKMAQEIAELKQMNAEFFRECVNVTGFVDANNELYNPSGRLELKEYALKYNAPTICQLATMGTLQYSAMLRDQYNKLKISTQNSAPNLVKQDNRNNPSSDILIPGRTPHR